MTLLPYNTGTESGHIMVIKPITTDLCSFKRLLEVIKLKKKKKKKKKKKQQQKNKNKTKQLVEKLQNRANSNNVDHCIHVSLFSLYIMREQQKQQHQ